MDAETMFETMIEVLGAKTLLDELSRALSTQELHECLEWIARNNDIDFEGEE